MPLKPRAKRHFHKIKKDYQVKNLRNPFFNRQQTTPGQRLKWRWYIIGSFTLLIALIYLLFLSPLFIIKTVIINGYSRVPEGSLENTIWQQTSQKLIWPFKQSNLWLFKSQQASNTLTSSFNLSKVTISKSLFNTLKINIEERPYAFIWQEQGAYSYSDNQGVIINQPVGSDDLKKMIIIANESSSTMISNGKINLYPEYLTFIFNLEGSLSKYPDFKIDHFIIDQDFWTVKVQLVNGPKLYFNIKDSIDKQIEKLLVVKNEKIKGNFSKTDYIDLRYGDKIYYFGKTN
jgi:cell division septal protein FtsQ